MPIKVLALDIYATVLAFNDHDYSCPPRDGLELLFDRCDERGIKVVTSSDGMTGNVKNDLAIAFRLVANRRIGNQPKSRLCIERFDNFFQLNQGLKDFSIIIGHYNIIPSELLVIGDNPNKDIYAALRLGANAIRCPMYGVDEGREWSFAGINLDAI